MLISILPEGFPLIFPLTSRLLCIYKHPQLSFILQFHPFQSWRQLVPFCNALLHFWPHQQCHSFSFSAFTNSWPPSIHTSNSGSPFPSIFVSLKAVISKLFILQTNSKSPPFLALIFLHPCMISDPTFKVQRELTPSSSTPHLILEKTKTREGIPSPLTLSILVAT